MTTPTPLHTGPAWTDPDPLLTPREVGAMFRVGPKAVARWATSGKLQSVRTPGGHLRFRSSYIRALRDGLTTAAQ